MKLRILALGAALAVSSGFISWHIADALSSAGAEAVPVKLEVVDSKRIMRLYDRGELTAITGTDSVGVELPSDGSLRDSIQSVVNQGDAEGVTWCLHPGGYAFPSGYGNLLKSEKGSVKVDENCEVSRERV